MLDPETGQVGRQGSAYRKYGPSEVATSFAGHLTFGLFTGILHRLFHSGGGINVAF